MANSGETAAALRITPTGDVAMLSKYDEETLLQKLVDYRQLTKQTNKEINRLQRKLVLRRLQRKSGRRCFDLADKARSLGVAFEGGAASDGKDGNSECGRRQTSAGGGPCALDRYKTADDCACTPSAPVGVVESEEEVKAILSPFTGRLLKPYIRRDLETKPPKLQLLEELCKSNGRSSKRSSIDFCYIRPQLIAPINHLARHFFWPGIDGENYHFPFLDLIPVMYTYAFLFSQCRRAFSIRISRSSRCTARLSWASRSWCPMKISSRPTYRSYSRTRSGGVRASPGSCCTTSCNHA